MPELYVCFKFQARGDLAVVPEPADLVSISQSRCSASDLLRMEAILASKLDNKQQVITSVLSIKHLSLGIPGLIG